MVLVVAAGAPVIELCDLGVFGSAYGLASLNVGSGLICLRGA